VRNNLTPAQPHVHTPIVQWPDSRGFLEGESSEKVPTQLCFSDEKVLWGFGIPEDEPRYQWFKLGLDSEMKQGKVSQLAADYPDPKAITSSDDNEHDPVHLTTQYLSQLRQHCERILRRKFGDTIVESTPLRYTITVPAIWSDSAKAKTLRCAADAGMGEAIQIISEPEAAIIYALDSLSLSADDLKVGDKFVLCDAGGGTVDLISKFNQQLPNTHGFSVARKD
jgi:hypothetical protein